MRLFYYIHDVGNFGDEISPVIVNMLLGKKVQLIKKHEISKIRRYEKFLFSLGSIFHFVQDGDVIWGTGVNAGRKNPKKLSKLDIRAIRGPLSRDFVIRNYGLPCPTVYGDPALLLPKLFPELQHNPVRKYSIIPHGGDIAYFQQYDNVISPVQDWQTVLRYILGSEVVISTGLHGIILAEAFGIPARWLRNKSLPSYHNEGVFKFNDYFLSTDRTPDDWAATVEDAIRLKGKPPIKVSFNGLANSFPRDVFSLQTRVTSVLAFLVDKLIANIQRRWFQSN